MKVHPKKYAQHWLRLNDPNDSLYHPAKAHNYYMAHKGDIDFIRSWWERTRDEWFRRTAIKLWRRYLTNKES